MRQEQSRALCKDGLRATARSESAKAFWAPCHVWQKELDIVPPGARLEVAAQYFDHLWRSLCLFSGRVSPPGVGPGLKKEQRTSSEVVKRGICIASGVGMWMNFWFDLKTSFLFFFFLISIREFLTSLFLQWPGQQWQECGNQLSNYIHSGG